MQSDEDVGKVSKHSPVLICTLPTCKSLHIWLAAHSQPPWGTAKSLELFLHDLLIKSAAVTQEKNGKSISPTHMYAFPPNHVLPAASAAIHL
jgi:hypothetical protein